MWLNYWKATRRRWTATGIVSAAILVSISGGLLVKFLMPSWDHSPTRLMKVSNDLEELRAALNTFAVDEHRCPTSNEGLRVLTECPNGQPAGWRGPYIKRVPVDPWGNPYIYRSAGNGSRYDLYSRGPEGKDQGGGGENISR
jgi:general secretion pathway protein G